MKITSLALIIAEPVVKCSYPGGIQGFLLDQVRTKGCPLRTESDGELVAVWDAVPERLVAAYARIRALKDQITDIGGLCVLVDPAKGVLAPCDWLTCSPSDDGAVTLEYCGTTGEESSEPRKTGAVRDDVGTAPHVPTLLKLAEKDGFVTWLDLDTGRQLTSVSLPPVVPANEESDVPLPMLTAITTMAEGRGWKVERNDDNGIVTLTLNAGPLLLLDLGFIISPAGDAVTLVVRLPGRVPEDRFPAVLQYLAGANWALEVGAFDFDLSDGEVVYRAAAIAPDGMLRPAAAEITLDRSMDTVKRYAAGLIEVASGAEPREVLKRVEE